MDDKLLEFLLDQGVPTFSMSSGLSLGDFGWGSPTFHKMGREKASAWPHRGVQRRWKRACGC